MRLLDLRGMAALGLDGALIRMRANRNLLAGSDLDEEEGERKDAAVPPRAMAYFTETDPVEAKKKRMEILKGLNEPVFSAKKKDKKKMTEICHVVDMLYNECGTRGQESAQGAMGRRGEFFLSAQMSTFVHKCDSGSSSRSI